MDSPDELFLGVDELKDFAQVIKPREENTSIIVVRKGTTDDILPESSSTTKTDTKEADSTSIGYSQEEFAKDFQEESYDLEHQFEDDCRQIIANYTITEREEQTLEEMADTVSSSQVFQGGRNRKMYVIRATLYQEDPKTVDIEVQDTKMIMFSHKYKMRVYFTKPVLTTNAKSTFIKDDHLLEIVVRQK